MAGSGQAHVTGTYQISSFRTCMVLFQQQHPALACLVQVCEQRCIHCHQHMLCICMLVPCYSTVASLRHALHAKLAALTSADLAWEILTDSKFCMQLFPARLLQQHVWHVQAV